MQYWLLIPNPAVIQIEPLSDRTANSIELHAGIVAILSEEALECPVWNTINVGFPIMMALGPDMVVRSSSSAIDVAEQCRQWISPKNGFDLILQVDRRRLFRLLHRIDEKL